MPRFPGPTCNTWFPVNVRDGTMALAESKLPGPIGLSVAGWDTGQKLLEAVAMAIASLPALVSAKNAAITSGIIRSQPATQSFIIPEILRSQPATQSLIASGIIRSQPATQSLIIAELRSQPATQSLIIAEILRSLPATQSLIIGEILRSRLATQSLIASEILRSLPATQNFGADEAVNDVSAIDALEDEYPLIRNPRSLAKHPGRVSDDELKIEIKIKGFTLVKTGSSEVYLRRIIAQDDGKEYFEAVRIDRMPNPKGNRNAMDGKDPGMFQAAERSPRQVHLSMDANDMPLNAQVELMQEGKAYKGDFSHWHHERFLVSRLSVEKYLEEYWNVAVKNEIERFDANGYVVGGRPRR